MPASATEATTDAVGAVIPKSASRTGAEPTTTSTSPCNWACRSMVTVCVAPRMARSPVAGTVHRSPSAGVDAKVIGWVSTKVALGKRVVARARWTASSRLESFVVTSLRSAVI